MIAKIAILLFAAHCVFGQELIERECESYPISTQAEFSVEKYLGLWHELMRYENVFQVNGECVTAEYSVREDGTVNVVNTMKVGENVSSIEGFAVEKNPEEHDGKLVVQFPESASSNYWVLGTDYENYSVVWSCYSYPGRSIQYMWVLARNTLVSTEVSRDIERVINENGLNMNLLRPTRNDKDNCGF